MNAKQVLRDNRQTLLELREGVERMKAALDKESKLHDNAEQAFMNAIASAVRALNR